MIDREGIEVQINENKLVDSKHYKGHTVDRVCEIQEIVKNLQNLSFFFTVPNRSTKTFYK